MAKKQIINARITDLYFSLYDLEGSVSSIIDSLREIEAKAEALGFKNIRVNIWDRYDETCVELCGDREETDEEYKIRRTNEKIARESRARAKAIEVQKGSEEYQQYLQLKEKFG